MQTSVNIIFENNTRHCVFYILMLTKVLYFIVILPYVLVYKICVNFNNQYKSIRINIHSIVSIQLSVNQSKSVNINVH
jgi:hypothetical protein